MESARSGLPSPLKSATTTLLIFCPTAGKTGPAVNVPSPLPSRIFTSLNGVNRLYTATARSGFPSPLKSATATHCGYGFVAGLLELKKCNASLPAGCAAALARAGAPFTATPPDRNRQSSAAREPADRVLFVDELAFM